MPNESPGESLTLIIKASFHVIEVKEPLFQHIELLLGIPAVLQEVLKIRSGEKRIFHFIIDRIDQIFQRVHAIGYFFGFGNSSLFHSFLSLRIRLIFLSSSRKSEHLLNSLSMVSLSLIPFSSQ